MDRHADEPAKAAQRQPPESLELVVSEAARSEEVDGRSQRRRVVPTGAVGNLAWHGRPISPAPSVIVVRRPVGGAGRTGPGPRSGSPSGPRPASLRPRTTAAVHCEDRVPPRSLRRLRVMVGFGHGSLQRLAVPDVHVWLHGTSVGPELTAAHRALRKHSPGPSEFRCSSSHGGDRSRIGHRIRSASCVRDVAASVDVRPRASVSFRRGSRLREGVAVLAAGGGAVLACLAARGSEVRGRTSR